MPSEIHPRNSHNCILDVVRAASSMSSELHPRSSRNYIEDAISQTSGGKLISKLMPTKENEEAQKRVEARLRSLTQEYEKEYELEYGMKSDGPSNIQPDCIPTPARIN